MPYFLAALMRSSSVLGYGPGAKSRKEPAHAAFELLMLRTDAFDKTRRGARMLANFSKLFITQMCLLELSEQNQMTIKRQHEIHNQLVR